MVLSPRFGLAVCAVLCALALPSAALAQTFTVTTTNDSLGGSCAPANCTLRQAIEAANTGSGADLVSVPAGTYELFFGNLPVEGEVTIEGAGSAATILDGNELSRVLFVKPGSTAEVRDLAVRNGVVVGSGGSVAKGGGILNEGDLSLSDVAVLHNVASAGSTGSAAPSGGGIYNGGTLRISGSTIEANEVTTATQTGIASGGGIATAGPLTVTDSLLSGNEANTKAIPQGGAIYASSGGGSPVPVTVTRSRLEGNRVINESTGGIVGGAAVAGIEASLTILESKLSVNRAIGGAIADGGALEVIRTELVVERSAITDNLGEASVFGDGGALFIANTAELSSRIVNSTLSGNGSVGTSDGGDGGAINHRGGPVEVIASTLYGNHAEGEGSGSEGGNLWSAGSEDGAIALRDSIVADGTAGKAGTENCGGEGIVSAGHNLESGSSCGFGAAGDRSDVDPRLGPLAENGGPTPTMALLAGSPALDAGADCPPVDQRGVVRPQGGACDIGAFELEVAPAALRPAPLPLKPSGPAKLKILGKLKIDPATGKGKLRVRCLNLAGDSCKVKLTLVAMPPPRAVASEAGASKLNHKLKLGRVSGTIAGGTVRALKVKLPKNARLLVANARKLTARIKGTSRNAAGAVTKVGGKVTVVAKLSKRP